MDKINWTSLQPLILIYFGKTELVYIFETKYYAHAPFYKLNQLYLQEWVDWFEYFLFLTTKRRSLL